jgi:hypothetical protein
MTQNNKYKSVSELLEVHLGSSAPSVEKLVVQLNKDKVPTFKIASTHYVDEEVFLSYLNDKALKRKASISRKHASSRSKWDGTVPNSYNRIYDLLRFPPLLPEKVMSFSAYQIANLVVALRHMRQFQLNPNRPSPKRIKAHRLILYRSNLDEVEAALIERLREMVGEADVNIDPDNIPSEGFIVNLSTPQGVTAKLSSEDRGSDPVYRDSLISNFKPTQSQSKPKPSTGETTP